MKFFCGKCFHTFNAYVKKDIDYGITDPRVNIEGETIFSYKCVCGNNAYEIDPLMFDFIVKLNKMGFYTECCCEGHSNDNKTVESGAYIMFSSSNEKYADGFHKMDKKKERFLKRFLRRYLRKNELLKWYFDSKWNKCLMLEVDYDSFLSDSLITCCGYEGFKHEYLLAFKSLINELEKEYKLKFNNRKV